MDSKSFSSLIYNNISSLDVLKDFDLVLCNFGDHSDVVDVGQRELVRSEQTISKPRPSHFGSKYSSTLDMKIGFLKKRKDGCQVGENFTQVEVEQVANWLYSSTLPAKLEILSDTWDREKYFCGVFTSISIQRMGSAWGLVAQFTNDSPFYYKNETLKIQGAAGTIWKPQLSVSVGAIRPVIVCAGNFNTMNYKTNLAFINDNKIWAHVTMTDTIYPLVIDCEHCIVYKGKLDENNKIMLDKNDYPVIDSSVTINFKDMGWTSPDDIKWLSCEPDQELDLKIDIEAGSAVETTLYYKAKFIGGIPDEFNV